MFKLCSTVILGLAIASSAHAAPLDFEGGYIGGYIANSDSDANTSFAAGERFVDTFSSGSAWGVYTGYNFAFYENSRYLNRERPPVILGFEFGYGSSDVSGAQSCPNPDFTCALDADLSGISISARAGLAFDKAMIYGRLGTATSGDITASTTTTTGDVVKDTKSMNGYVLGIGAELMTYKNYSVRIEAQKIDYGSESFTVHALEEVDADVSETRILLGIQYNF